jgi:AraC-like DNA-binding protein
MANRQTLQYEAPQGPAHASGVLSSEMVRGADHRVDPASCGAGFDPLSRPIDSVEISLRDRVEDACHRLEQSEAAPARLGLLAEYLGISPRQANRCFHAVGLSSPMKEIRRRRLREALDLIQTSSRTLEEIAADFNYYDGSSLSRALKRAFGLPPIELRNGRLRASDRV